MGKMRAVAVAGLMLWTSGAGAAERAFPVRAFDGPEPRWYQFHPRPARMTAFRLELVSDDGGLMPESSRRGRPFVAARDGERYAVRLYNPLPVRAAVNLTVDGLNSISGKPSGIADGQMWMIEPYSSIVIRGWQVNGEEARRFFFTAKPKSYAKWRGDALGREFSANCGVIGAAFFWNQGELDAYYRDRWIERRRAFDSAEMGMPAPGAGMAASRGQLKKAADGARQEAGTGMGERESNPTVSVEFHPDAGMYRASDALLVYYDFAAPEPEPNAFPGLSYAPEMP